MRHRLMMFILPLIAAKCFCLGGNMTSTTQRDEEQTIFRVNSNDRIRRALTERFGSDPIAGAEIDADLNYALEDKWFIVVIATVRGTLEFDAKNRWVKGNYVTLNFSKTNSTKDHLFESSGVITIESPSKKVSLPFCIKLQPTDGLTRGRTKVTGQVIWGEVKDLPSSADKE